MCVGLCERERSAESAINIAAAKCTAANPPLLRTWAYAPWRVPAAGAAGRFMDRQSKREILILAIGTIMVEVPVAAIAVIAILAH